jgi:hypothetical protein
MPGGVVAGAAGVAPVEASGLLSDLHEVISGKMVKTKGKGSGLFVKFIFEARESHKIARAI